MPEKSAEDDKSADAPRRDRFDALLGAIEDEMRGCLELRKDGNRADDERILLLEGDRVREAARYLRDVGLEPSAIELMNRYTCYFDAVSELAYCAIFRSFPSSERDLNHTRLGLPEPERSDAEHAEQQQTRSSFVRPMSRGSSGASYPQNGKPLRPKDRSNLPKKTPSK